MNVDILYYILLHLFYYWIFFLQHLCKIMISFHILCNQLNSVIFLYWYILGERERSDISPDVYLQYTLYIRVEWLTTFFDFWKCTHCCRLGIFLWVKSQKIGKFCRVSVSKFSFSKNHKGLKNGYYINEHLPKRKLKIKKAIHILF